VKKKKSEFGIKQHKTFCQ